MSPLEIRQPNGLGTEFLTTIPRRGTDITIHGSLTTDIHWEEEIQTAYVRTDKGAPLEEVPLYPNDPTIVGRKTHVTGNVYCIEDPLLLIARE